MAYFGYKDSDDDGKRGAVSSINAAYELQISFEEIKLEWNGLKNGKSNFIIRLTR
jgi:hypothetical protein